MSSPSKLSEGLDASSAHSWLEERVYAPKRERTFELVQQSVDVLLKRKERVSLASIMQTSREVDPEGRGISESAILGNDQARAYYEQHRTWKNSRKRLSSILEIPPPSVSGSIKLDRDEQRARRRYLRMGKDALVERLMAVEPGLFSVPEMSEMHGSREWLCFAPLARCFLASSHLFVFVKRSAKCVFRVH